MDGDIKPLHFKTSRQGNARFCRQINVEHALAIVAVKMAMLRHIWTKAGCPSFEADMPDQAAMHEGVQAIIDRSHRNIRHALFGADKYLFGSGMVTVTNQNGVHM